MLGNMIRQPLLTGSLIDHAANYHADTRIMSVETDGEARKTCWRETWEGARRLAKALGRLGLQPGDRCGTIAWNNRRHLQIYFGVSAGGYVCHTINPRLFTEQLVYIVNHAEDTVLFFDKTFAPLIANVRDKLVTVRHFIYMGSSDADISAQIPGVLYQDELCDLNAADYRWPDLSEDSASSLCYTSGTTGDPKGVLYSHRSTVLHSLVAALPDSLSLSAAETVLPVVPMFHVNAWGVPYAAALVGSELILPGPNLDGDSLVELIDRHRVTLALGVPTIWRGLLEAADRSGSGLESLARTVIGGSACPPSMIETFRERYQVDVIHAWGMTETSPLGSANRPLARHLGLDKTARHRLSVGQGRPPYGVELKVVDDEGNTQPRDGKSRGVLMARGPWIAERYFKADAAMLKDGWFDTGDIATLDPDGYLDIHDRSKDIIKSGGEWISSVAIENLALAHPDIADAAVIGVPHPRWDERPVLIAVPAAAKTPDEQNVLAWIGERVAKWQIPDKMVLVDQLPRNATGKVIKTQLRAQYQHMLEDTVEEV